MDSMKPTHIDSKSHAGKKLVSRLLPLRLLPMARPNVVKVRAWQLKIAGTFAVLVSAELLARGFQVAAAPLARLPSI